MTKLRLIATEEAFATPRQVEAFRRAADTLWHDPDLDMWRSFLSIPRRIAQLVDLEEERLADMDANGVDMHLLSLTAPGVQLFSAAEATAIAADANDILAETVRRHPTRFAGLATFAPQDPARAAQEIERAINTLGLHGLVINSHTDSEYLDAPKFRPIFEAAASCGAALYIHPRNLPLEAAKFLKAEINLWGAIWGFQMETGLHAMRLIVSGLFDEFPGLKIVLGHMGEGLPYWLYRIDYMYRAFTRGQGKLKRRPSDYVRDNFLVTTSGMNDHATLDFCHRVLGPDNVMFAIDYPYQGSKEAVEFIRSSTLPPADLAKIAHGNAERVFRIKPAV